MSHSRYLDFATPDSLIHFSSVEGVLSQPLLSLEDACVTLSPFISNIKKYVWLSKKETEDNHLPLTHDEAASINLYTREEGGIFYIYILYLLSIFINTYLYLFYLFLPLLIFLGLYKQLNEKLRERDRTKLKPFFSFLKLFMTALHKLPPYSETIYRGIQGKLRDVYEQKVKKEVIWWGASSCTKAINVIENFIGSGEKTIFAIRVLNLIVLIFSFDFFL
jgi:hypothetical protein